MESPPRGSRLDFMGFTGIFSVFFNLGKVKLGLFWPRELTAFSGLIGRLRIAKTFLWR